MTVKVCGSIARRTHDSLTLKKGEVVWGHKHKFTHTTVAMVGGFLVLLLNVKDVDVHGRPINYTVDAQYEIWANTENDMAPVVRGRHHMLAALEDGSRYGCYYVHQHELAIAFDEHGNPEYAPEDTYTDDSGALWLRYDKGISEEYKGNVNAYA